MQKDISETVKEIKQSFRILMNGVTAQSMREKGLDYHINWGANLLHLREMAKEYTPSRQLAQTLWQENVRECKILATLLMPKDDFSYDLATLWIEQTHSREIAEVATQNLYQHLPYSTELAMRLISLDSEMQQLHGYLILARLFVKGVALDERDANEFVDQAIVVLQDSNNAVKHAAMNALQHFAELDELSRAMAFGALKQIGMEEWI
ncbi:MAG: DNA alkylation repair protein [Prevotella sp.]|nr:DNA alkylation repair protein [Candidatus Prevotella equi]